MTDDDVRKYRPWVRRAACRFSRQTGGDAHDLEQATWLYLVERWEKYGPILSAPLITTIVRNLSFDAVRKWRVRQDVNVDAPSHREAEQASADDPFTATAVSQAMRHMAALLTAKQFTAMLLFGQGYSDAAHGELVGCHENLVRYHRLNAQRKLRAAGLTRDAII